MYRCVNVYAPMCIYTSYIYAYTYMFIRIYMNICMCIHKNMYTFLK